MPDEITAKEALECAKAIMEGMKKKAIDYIGEWNTLLLFLERMERSEAKTDTEE